MRRLSILAALLICFCVPQAIVSCSSPGQKLLQMDVLLNGEKVLVTHFDVADSSSISEIWDAAGEIPFDTEVNALSVSPNQHAPLKAELTGSVVIRITHVASVQTHATLADLTLVRSASTATDWRLSAVAISRSKKAAGL